MSTKKKSEIERPVSVVPGKNKKHKTETRIFARNIHETFCVHPGCKFEGEHAAQNVCHTLTTFEGSMDWSYMDSVIAAGEKYVTEIRKISKKQSRTDKEYIKRLESELACMWMNSICGLDQLVRLRGEVATLRKLKKSGK